MIKTFIISATTVLLSCSSFAQTIIYVDADATGNNDGTSWADAYTDAYTAIISNTVNNAEFWIAEGFYSTPSETQSFEIQNGEEIYGGFNGTETARDQRDFRNNVTILSGDSGWNDGNTSPGQTSNWMDNSEHVIEIASTMGVVIDGFTIENGYGDNSAGGGIYVSSSSLSALTIKNCIIRNNGALNRAGVLYYSDYPTAKFYFFNNRVENNYNLGNDAYTIEFRLSDGNGLLSGVGHIVNNLFQGNSCATSSAGAICGRFTNLSPGTLDIHLLNNIIIDNPHGTSIPAPFGYEFGNTNGSTNLFINNNILYNNTNVSHIMALTGGSNSQVNYATSYQNIQDFPDMEGLTNTHVVTSSPFVDYNNGNYGPVAQYQTTGRYQAYSTTLYPTYDLLGNPRLTSSGQIGIGAIQATGTTSISELNDATISVYPNPANDFFTVEWNEASTGEITLMNLVGQAVMNQKIDGTSVSCDASQLESGVYIAIIELEGKIVKTNITLH